MNQKIIPLVSVAVGVVAFLLTFQYLRGKEAEVAERIRKLEAGMRRIEVLATVSDIPGGTVLKRNDLGFIEMIESTAPEQVIRKSEADMLLGKKTLFQIKARKPILWSDIEGAEAIVQGLSPSVKPGMRALSIAVGGASAVSGMVQPNDRVDVLGTFSLPSHTVPGQMETITLTVLQDVIVLATGQQMARDILLSRSQGRISTGYSAVTVEVTPREAELLVFAQQVQGRLTLTLRNRGDISFEKDLPELNFKLLETELPQLNLYRQRKIWDKNMP